MRYTISEMASLLGVTTHTLRYYEKMGLIHPEVNEDTGYRYYTGVAMSCGIGRQLQLQFSP